MENYFATTYYIVIPGSKKLGNPASFRPRETFPAKSQALQKHYQDIKSPPQIAEEFPNKSKTKKIYKENNKKSQEEETYIKTSVKPNPKNLYKESFLLGRRFASLEEEVVATTSLKFSLKKECSQYLVYTFFALNCGHHPGSVTPQISPDGHHWLKDGLEEIVAPGEMKEFVFNTFSRYVRLAVVTTKGETNFKIWFQAQV